MAFYGPFLQGTPEATRGSMPPTETIINSTDTHWFECAPLPYLILDGAGVVLDANREARQILGRTRSQLQGTVFLDRLVERDRDALSRFLAGQPPIDTRVSMVLHLRLANGAEAPYAAKMSVTRPPGDTSRRISCIFYPHEPDGDWVLNSLGDGVIALDACLLVARMNPAAQCLTGLHAQKAIGKPLGVVLQLRNMQTHAVEVVPVEEALEQGRAIKNRNHVCLLTQNGEQVPVSVSVFPVRHEQKGFAGTVVVLRETSDEHAEHRILEEQLHQAQRLGAVGQLAGGVAHDFNNLLQVISGNLEFVRMHTSNRADTGEYLHEASHAVDRAVALVRQLLSFSRREPARMEYLDVNEIIRGLGKMLDRMVGERIILEVELADVLPRIRGDAGQLEQVIMNLCVNARDAMPDGGRITISTAQYHLVDSEMAHLDALRPGKHVCIWISDEGGGVPAEIQRQVFEPFFTTKEPDKGTGLGLAIADQIVRKHQGYIHLQNRPGRGASFGLYLPAVDSQTAPGKDQRELESSMEGRGETLLLAEDERQVRVIVERLLAVNGDQVITANNGREAMELFRMHALEIDLVVLDVVMPGYNGREVHDMIKRARPDIPVLFTSGYSFQHLEQDDDNLRDLHFMQKPVKPKAFLRKIRQLLDDPGKVQKASRRE